MMTALPRSDCSRHRRGLRSQSPFALVIVGGLFSRLLISVFLMPVLYAYVAREDDRLEV